eukprot:553258-Amphidinium_carterae.1
MLAGAATVGYGMHALKASREADAEEKLKAKQEKRLTTKTLRYPHHSNQEITVGSKIISKT